MSIERMTKRTAYYPDSQKVLIQAKWGFHFIAGNSAPYFSITGDSHKHGCGCIHDALVKQWPDLAELVRWHLTDQGGTPSHHVANGVYHWRRMDMDAFVRHTNWGKAKGDGELPTEPNWPDGYKLDEDTSHTAQICDYKRTTLCMYRGELTDIREVMKARIPQLREAFNACMDEWKIERITRDECERAIKAIGGDVERLAVGAF